MYSWFDASVLQYGSPRRSFDMKLRASNLSTVFLYYPFWVFPGGRSQLKINLLLPVHQAERSSLQAFRHMS